MNTPICTFCKKEKGTLFVSNIILCPACFKSAANNELPTSIRIHYHQELKNHFGPSDDEQNSYSQTRSKTRTNRRNSVLDQYCHDLTDAALKGEIDPIIGREKELSRMVHILNLREKNNPVLIGEPGVGKTAMAEGLALRIAHGDVPEKMKNKRILSLDMTAVTAGTIYRGQFEDRMKKIIDEVQKRKNIILFIDELHMMMGAGSANESNMDAANIIKPHLSKGTFQIIGATTLDEYRIIEKDKALGRRFQKITIQEPSHEDTFRILKGTVHLYENHHDVSFSDDILRSAIALSDRYIAERYMPDKAIGLLDEVGSELNLLRSSSKQTTLTKMKREMDRAAEAEEFEKAMALKKQILLLENEPENDIPPKDVTISQLERTIERMTGIPVQKMNTEESNHLQELEGRLKKYVIGQNHAVETIATAVKRKRFNVRNQEKPLVFAFSGPTGVGKTELAKRLAEDLFGSKENILRFDMSEYMEKHTVSKLIGAPPGYVGHEKSGRLTEAIRRKPYSVILLDEIEKAHPDVLNLFLQVMDDGRLTDSDGRTVDFKHTILIMTSNLGATTKPSIDAFASTTETKFVEALRSHFTPEFINRLDDVVSFRHLDEADLVSIVDLQVEGLKEGLNKKNISLTLSEDAKKWLAKKGYDQKYGARPLARTVVKELDDVLIDYLFNANTKPTLVEVTVNDTTDKLAFAYR